MKEIQSINLRNPRKQEIVGKPFFNNKDMVLILSAVCGGLLTHLLFTSSKTIWYSKVQFTLAVILVFLAVFLIVYWITQEIVKFCGKKTLRI